METPAERARARHDDGIRDLYAILRDALVPSLGPAQGMREAASITSRVASALAVTRPDIPNPAFAADLERALLHVLADQETLALPECERAGLLAVSLLAALDRKWAFRLRPEWLLDLRAPADQPQLPEKRPEAD